MQSEEVLNEPRCSTVSVFEGTNGEEFEAELLALTGEFASFVLAIHAVFDDIDILFLNFCYFIYPVAE